MRIQAKGAALIAMSFGLAGQAMAGECPEAERHEAHLSGAPEKPSGAVPGFTETIDLHPEIGVEGWALQVRHVTLQPGARVPAHSHAGRPSIMYVISGEATENNTRCLVPIVHREGDVIREVGNFSDWWSNRGLTPTVLFVTEVVSTNQK